MKWDEPSRAEQDEVWGAHEANGITASSSNFGQILTELAAAKLASGLP